MSVTFQTLVCSSCESRWKIVYGDASGDVSKTCPMCRDTKRAWRLMIAMWAVCALTIANLVYELVCA